MTALRGRFTRRGGGAIVHFDHPPIPDVIRFADADWRAKREFHITLAGTTMMREPGVVVVCVGTFTRVRLPNCSIRACPNSSMWVRRRERPLVFDATTRPHHAERGDAEQCQRDHHFEQRHSSPARVSIHAPSP